MKQLLLATSALALLVACSPSTPSEPSASAEATAAASDFVPRPVEVRGRDEWGEFGIDLESVKASVAPGTNFFEHVNGVWLDEFVMPDDASRYGGFTILREKSEGRVRNIIEELASASPSVDTLNGKIAALYNAYMDVDAIEATGLSNAQPFLDEIAAISSYEDLAHAFGSSGYSSPVGGFVDLDSKQPDTYVFQITQSGLGLPDRNYYLEDNERNEAIRAAYRNYLTILLHEAGYEDVGATADAVLALETRIAAEHWDRTVSRDRNLTYNKLTRDDLLKLGAGFPVAEMLAKIGTDNQEHFLVRQVLPTEAEVTELGLSQEQLSKLGGGIGGLFRVAAETDLDTWKAYLTAQFLSDYSAVLPATIDNASFEMYGKTLRGQEVQRDRWKRAVGAVEGALGEGVGQIYAERHFPAENKTAMDELVENLRRAMAVNLDDITWMGEATKVEARDKLAKFAPKIGFTERFETYDTLSLSTDNALGNSVASGDWAFRENLAKLGKPVDKTEWFMFPQTVNAYYSPVRNEIVFPAGILQPPFFNLAADPAVNYGAIGGVIGHEMGHGFDDQGAKSDGDGFLRNWWTDEDGDAFKALTDALVAQFDSFCPLDNGETCVNGRLTLGENIGDLGGLSMAYRAYQISLNGEEAPIIEGLTGDQRFFMAWAQVWRNKIRDEALAQQMIGDPHAPARYRVNGVVRNFDEWYEAFGITEDDPLYLPPEQRIRIW
ncbi:MAG: M13 family metallopeptidase [Hyphomonadaceae bacterium]